MGIEKKPQKGKIVIVWDSAKGYKENLKKYLMQPQEDEDYPEVASNDLEERLIESDESDKIQYLTEEEARKKLIDGMNSESNDELYFAGIAEPMLERLRSHKRGKPSLAYALIKRGIEESSKKRESELASVEEQIASKKEALAQKVTELKSNKLRLDTARNVGDELIERKDQLERQVQDLEAEVSRLSHDSEGLMATIQRIEGEMRSILSENTKIEESTTAQGLTKEGVSKETPERFGVKKFSADISVKLDEELKKQSSLSEKTSEKSKLLRDQNARKDRIAVGVNKIKRSLGSIASSVGVNTSKIDDEKKENIGFFAHLIKKLARRESRFGVVSSRPVEEGKPDIFVNKKIREVNEGSEKSFKWDHSKDICGNLTSLLSDYKLSSGYHSKDRLASATKVLEKIIELGGDPDRDKKIMDFIREQEIGSHGIRGIRSKLHSIYLEAELVHRENLIMLKKERDKELKSLEEELSSQSSKNDSIKLLAEGEDQRNIRQQWGLTPVQQKNAKLQGQTKVLMRNIQDDQNAIFKKCDRLTNLQKQNLLLRMKYRLSNTTSLVRKRSSDNGLTLEEMSYLRKELEKLGAEALLDSLSDREAQFLVAELSRLDALNATIKKNHEAKYQLAADERGLKLLTVENNSEAASVRLAYHAVQSLSRQYEGETLPKVAEVKKLEEIVTRISTFANAIQGKSPTTAPSESSSEELSSDSDTENSQEDESRFKNNPFL